MLLPLQEVQLWTRAGERDVVGVSVWGSESVCGGGGVLSSRHSLSRTSYEMFPITL